MNRAPPPAPPAMTLRFLGHAAFDMHFAGLRVCLDPHRPGAVGGRFQLPAITGPFDAVACTHGHEDHAGWTPALGTTRILDESCDLGGLQLTTRAAFHDTVGGTRMGLVRMLSFTDGRTRVVHCGDLSDFNDDDVAWLRGCDVLLVPAGGSFTLDGAQAATLAARVQPRWVVPMHTADPRIDLPLRPVSDFLKAWTGPVHSCAILDLQAPPPSGALVMAAP